MDKSKKAFDYEIVEEGNEQIMKINAEGLAFLPSIEESELVMSRAIDNLVEAPYVKRLLFTQRRNYEYGYDNTQMLIEIALIYNKLIKEKRILSLSTLSRYSNYQSLYSEKHGFLQYLILTLLKQDPLGAYVEIKREIRNEKIKLEMTSDNGLIDFTKEYIESLEEIFNMLDKTKLVSLTRDVLQGYELGDRSAYFSVFRPTITPDFMFTRLMAQHPVDGDDIDIYKVGDAEVVIYSVPNDVKYLYHLTPPEFKITEDKYALLDLARSVLMEHQPKEKEFLDPDKMRVTFANIGRDLLGELAAQKGIILSLEETESLANILVRYTVGFGLLEVLLQDQKIQDITINGPIGETAVFLVHQDYGDCVTNIIPSASDAQSWATKFRLISGRPLDEANPVLDTELVIPSARARVGIIQEPLSPYGLSYAFRRHRDDPWTYPLFIKNRMINSLAAGLLSFMVDGSRTMLFAGTRSSGKTSLLDATLIEIMRKYRIITIEDTQELSSDSLRKLGYNILSMKVRSALTTGGTEMGADEGIRTSLRLGDSSLIVGEIRSKEAFALYEAMRIGALANVVAGTIHGDSPYGVFDRVVNDLQVPRTSFKATDIIIVANPLKSPDGLHSWRRVMQITEVRKHWEDDPLRERGFVDLMKYNPKTDELEPTDDLINGDSEILKSIGSKVKDWVGDWDAIWENILLRAKIKQALVDYSAKMNNPRLLEAKFMVMANDQFHKLTDSVREETGNLDNKRIYYEWDEWFKGILKRGR